MAHNLFGERFLGRREPAWHNLGQVFPEDERLSVTEAFERAHLMYRFEKMPLEVTLPSGERVQVPQVAVMREPTFDDAQWRTMSIVEPDFGIIQHSDLAQQLNPLGERWPVETVGALDSGKTVFVTLATGGYEIAKDEMKRYLLVSDGKGGDHALRLACVDIRVVCQNTLEAAWGRASSTRIAFPHHADVASDLKLYTELFEQVAAAQERQKQAFELLAKTRITRDDAQDIISAAHPEPQRSRKLAMLNGLMERAGFLPATAQELMAREQQTHESECQRMRLLQVAGMQSYEKMGDENPLVAGTAWAAYNAAVEISDCRNGPSAETSAASTLFGVRALERSRAFRAAWDLTGAARLS